MASEKQPTINELREMLVLVYRAADNAALNGIDHRNIDRAASALDDYLKQQAGPPEPAVNESTGPRKQTA